MDITPLPLLFKRAGRKRLARWASLAKEPDCREGDGGRVRSIKIERKRLLRHSRVFLNKSRNKSFYELYFCIADLLEKNGT